MINFPNVTFLDLENEALKEVYSNAKIFCMPPFYESSRYPHWRATPDAIWCLAIKAPKSIFGKRAEYFDPNDFAGMEDAIKHSLPSQKTIDLEHERIDRSTVPRNLMSCFIEKYFGGWTGPVGSAVIDHLKQCKEASIHVSEFASGNWHQNAFGNDIPRIDWVRGECAEPSIV